MHAPGNITPVAPSLFLQKWPCLTIITLPTVELHLINNLWYIYFGGENIVPGQEVGIRKLFVLQGLGFGPLGTQVFLSRVLFFGGREEWLLSLKFCG